MLYPKEDKENKRLLYAVSNCSIISKLQSCHTNLQTNLAEDVHWAIPVNENTPLWRNNIYNHPRTLTTGQVSPWDTKINTDLPPRTNFGGINTALRQNVLSTPQISLFCPKTLHGQANYNRKYPPDKITA